MTSSTTTDATDSEFDQRKLQCLEMLNATTEFTTTRSGEFAHKDCDEDGEWFRHPLTNRTWSNYTTCVNLDKLEASCITLHLVLHYFLITNYAWMLCEGFYLHTVLVSAFVSEKKLVNWLVVLGWTTPGIVIMAYGFLRGYAGTPEDTIECWMNESVYDNVFKAPVCISMLLNLLFLCNIIRVVLLKLKAPAGPQGTGPSRTILQAFRATLLLVPLLGLQYILTPFRPDPGHSYERTYEIISAFTASFQGLFVAVLFCFFNGEVIAQVKRKWRTVFLRTRTNSYTATQVS
ncbi:AAEL010043-PA, partial [Aedes aegypti]